MSQQFNNARKCAKCGHEWIKKNAATKLYVNCTQLPGDNEPKRCPRCRSEKWQQEQQVVSVK
jgi:predicted Zn-ribbon and HTH transcriptional regulator